VARKIQGTWKIAYADFITALMVLFLMLWLVGTIPEEDLLGISEYFSETPTNKKIDYASQSVTQQNFQIQDTLSMVSLSDLPSKDREMFATILQSVKESDVQKEFADNMCVYWHNGVVVEIFDTHNRSLFVSSTANLQPWAVQLINTFGSKVVNCQKDYIVIDGHASKMARNSDCWNLSFCIANVVRRYLEKYAREDQILKVTGNGDRDLIDKNSPNSPCNMRISITFVDKKFVSKRQRSFPS
jgi:chemotaxis protein MotB